MELPKNDTICLNCGTKTIGKYCHNCKQKSDTKRLSFKHFVMHDVLHGAFHLDKGLLFTIKEIILRPGKVASDYIKGKRVSYYNFFYLVLILIGLMLLLDTLTGGDSMVNSSDSKEVKNFLRQYQKAFYLSFIPMFTLASSAVYRKVKLNLSEHSIVAAIALVYSLLVNLLAIVIHFFLLGFEFVYLLLMLAVIGFVYYKTFEEYYSTKKHLNLMNTVLTTILFFILVCLLLIIIIIVVYRLYFFD